MFAAILKWFVGGGISSIGEQINRWQDIKAKAANDHERLEADKMLASLEASKQVILQAQRDPVERWVRIGFALPFLAFNIKLVVWDKMLGLGVTDPLSPELFQVEVAVLGGYFLHSIVRGK